MMRIILAVLIAGLATGLYAQNGGDEMEPYFLLDDFRSDNPVNGRRWEGFTDRVMGGRSDMSVTRRSEGQEDFVRMTGNVTLENNGGFIQIRLTLAPRGRVFDGSRFGGIRLKVRGEGEGYYLFLRTSSTVMPWKYFAAPLNVKSDWRVVDIPWTDFAPGDYGRMGPLKVKKLRSVAVVAYGRAFRARIDVAEIGLFF